MSSPLIVAQGQDLTTFPPDAASAEIAEEFSEEPILRGPIHEAFAEPFELTPTPDQIVAKAPPADVQEVPPAAKPEGDHVEWINGYWSWDDDRADFIWVSGVWRRIPNGRRWNAGHWEEVVGGHQWVPGAWLPVESSELEVLPQPPDSLEEGPTGPAPSDDHFWIPGCWEYRGQYVWRPGFWSPSYTNWVWVPGHYMWTPRGCAFVSGYWDYTWDRRGTLFAPCYFGANLLAQTGYRYTPQVVVDCEDPFVHLWVRPGYHHLYFGDYYDRGHLGYSPWYRYCHRLRAYDPLYTHYRWAFSLGSSISFYSHLENQHRYYSSHQHLRPAKSLHEQRRLQTSYGHDVHARRSIAGHALRDYDISRRRSSYDYVRRAADLNRDRYRQELRINTFGGRSHGSSTQSDSLRTRRTILDPEASTDELRRELIRSRTARDRSSSRDSTSSMGRGPARVGEQDLRREVSGRLDDLERIRNRARSPSELGKTALGQEDIRRRLMTRIEAPENARDRTEVSRDKPRTPQVDPRINSQRAERVLSEARDAARKRIAGDEARKRIAATRLSTDRPSPPSQSRNRLTMPSQTREGLAKPSRSSARVGQSRTKPDAPSNARRSLSSSHLGGKASSDQRSRAQIRSSRPSAPQASANASRRSSPRAVAPARERSRGVRSSMQASKPNRNDDRKGNKSK